MTYSYTNNSQANSGYASALEAAQENRKIKLNEILDDPFIGYETFVEASEDCKCSSQAEVLARLLNRENLFISGPAGSGKTFIINRFVELLDAEFNGKLNIALTASTGIAAQLIGGRTLHSWSGLGISTEPFRRGKLSPTEWAAKDRIKEADVLIIDEVSMLPAYLFTKLDALMKYFRRNNKPFGGVQLIVMGDFMQLPPIDKKDPDVDARFAFFTDAWKQAGINYTYMDKARRATDSRLKHLLLQMSKGKMDQEARDYIEERVNRQKNPKKTYATLFTVNKDVDAYNNHQLSLNPNQEVVYNSICTGNPKDYDKIMKTYGLAEQIKLKVGATVIVTANIDSELPNGTVAVVEKLAKDFVFIRMNNGSSRAVDRREYQHKEKIEMVNAEGEEMTIEIPVATVTQMPLRLGYAISVHKSQGQTFDGVVTDLSKCFTAGLGYVALSRVKSLDDLIITDIRESAYKVDRKSMRVAHHVKKQALINRKKLLSDPSPYEALLTNEFARHVVWGDIVKDREEKL